MYVHWSHLKMFPSKFCVYSGWGWTDNVVMETTEPHSPPHRAPDWPREDPGDLYALFHTSKPRGPFRRSLALVPFSSCLCKSISNITHATNSNNTGWFLGPRGPLVLPLVDPSARVKNLDHLYIGTYASWIIRRLIKPTWCPHEIP